MLQEAVFAFRQCFLQSFRVVKEFEPELKDLEGRIDVGQLPQG
jgi:hypothetical protein